MKSVLGTNCPGIEIARKAGLTVHTLAETGRGAACRRLLKKQKIDLISAHCSVYGTELASELGIPVVQTVHNTLAWLDAAERRAYQRVDKYTTAYVPLSDAVAHYSDIRLKLPPEKMVVIENQIRVPLVNKRKAGILAKNLGKNSGFHQKISFS